MKKLLIFVLFISSHVTYAQFTLSPEGLTAVEDEAVPYVIMKVDGLSQQELYNKTLTYLNKSYESPKDVISKVENESITVNATAPREVKSQYKRAKSTLDLDHTITYLFKDEKVKFEVVQWQAGRLELVHDFKLFDTVLGIYDEKKVLQNEKAKNSIEGYFNDYYQNYRQEINKKSDW